MERQLLAVAGSKQMCMKQPRISKLDEEIQDGMGGNWMPGSSSPGHHLYQILPSINDRADENVKLWESRSNPGDSQDSHLKAMQFAHTHEAGPLSAKSQLHAG